jgi:hypothetical protein
MDETATETELLQELQMVAGELTHPPTESEINRYSDFSAESYRGKFGSLREAREMAGIGEPSVPIPTSPVDKGSPYPETIPSHDTLLQDLYLILNSVGRIPTETEIQQFGVFKKSDFVSQFGSLRAAVERIEEDLSGKEIALDDLAQHLREVGEIAGRPPLAIDVLQANPVLLRKFGAYFDSWEAVLQFAGFKPGTYTPVSRKELLDSFIHLWEQLGRPPLPEDVEQNTSYSALTYIRRFGNWCGLFQTTDYPTEIPEETYQSLTRLLLALELRRVVAQTEDSPSIDAVYAKSRFKIEAYQREFTRWSDAVEAAGLTISERKTQSGTPSLTEVREAFDEIRDSTPVPTFATVVEHGSIDPRAIFNKFPSWELTTTLAKIPYSAPAKHISQFPRNTADLVFEDRLRIDEGLASDAILLNDFDRVADEASSIPRPLEIELLGAFSPETYISQYGSWRNVIKHSASNIEECSSLQPIQRKHIFGSLLLTLERLAIQIGEVPSESDIDTYTQYTSTSYIAAFNDFDTAVASTGVRPDEPNGYVQDVLAAELYRLADEFDRKPPKKVLPELLPYDISAVETAFGSIKKAWAAANRAGPGRVPRWYGPEEIDEYREQLISAAPEPSSVSGEFSPRHLADMTPFSPETYISVFGTFEAVTAAVTGSSIPEDTVDSTTQESAESGVVGDICSALWNVAFEAGAPVQLVLDLYKKTGSVPISTIETHCTELETAAQIAGLELDKRTDIPITWYSSLGVDLADELGRVSEIVDGRPTIDEVNAHSVTPVTTYVLRFGSWEAACDVLLSDDTSNTPNTDSTAPVRSATEINDGYSRTELINAIRSVADELGRIPTKDDVQEHSELNYTVISNRFGSWREALLEAELLLSDPSIDLDTPIRDVAEDIGSLGPSGVLRLREAGYESIRDVYNSTRSELMAVDEIGPTTATNIVEYCTE